MSISTKNGDNGQTALWSGQRVWKDDLRVEAYGTIDELSSIISEAKHYIKQEKIKEILLKVQKDLSRLAAQLASTEDKYNGAITAEDEIAISQYVKDFEHEVQLHGLVVLGSCLPSAKLDIARTVCRRAERRIISLSRKESLSCFLIQYVNRLSDLLFIMARAIEKAENCIEYL